MLWAKRLVRRLSDPVENAKVIVSELEQYSEKLAQKPRWLVFNKIDLMAEDEAEALCQSIAEQLEWDGPIYMISAVNGLNTKDLCNDIADALEEMPKEVIVDREEKVEFQWDNYHSDAMEDLEDDLDDDDWNEDDYDVEVIYKP